MTGENRQHRLAEARDIHHAGRLDVARAAYEALLGAAPEDAEVRGLLGVLALQEGRLDDAEALLRQAVAGGGEARIHLRNLNNLLALLQQTGSVEAAPALASGELPDWPEGVVPDAGERQTVLSLCRALLLLDQPPAARRLLDRAFPQPDDDAEALGLAGRVLLALGETAPAAEVLERAAELAPGDCQPLIALSYAQEKLGQVEAARATVRKIATSHPVYSTASQPSQRASILVLSPNPSKVSKPDNGLYALHFATNFATQFAVSMRAEFRFLSVFAELPSAKLPQSDVILNNCVDPETMNVPGRLELVAATMERVGAPVINHPRAVFATTRQKAAALLAGTPT